MKNALRAPIITAFSFGPWISTHGTTQKEIVGENLSSVLLIMRGDLGMENQRRCLLKLGCYLWRSDFRTILCGS